MRDTPEWLPTTVFQRFCAAIVYSKREGSPDDEELAALNSVLADIASLAIRGNVTPERMVLELKKGWIHVCHREPSPDMDDPEWTRLLPLALDAFERQRAEAT